MLKRLNKSINTYIKQRKKAKNGHCLDEALGHFQSISVQLAIIANAERCSKDNFLRSFATIAVGVRSFVFFCNKEFIWHIQPSNKVYILCPTDDLMSFV